METYDINLGIWFGLSIFIWMTWPIIVFSRWRTATNNILVTCVIAILGFPLTVVILIILLMYSVLLLVQFVYYLNKMK